VSAKQVGPIMGSKRPIMGPKSHEMAKMLTFEPGPNSKFRVVRSIPRRIYMGVTFDVIQWKIIFRKVSVDRKSVGPIMGSVFRTPTHHEGGTNSKFWVVQKFRRLI